MENVLRVLPSLATGAVLVIVLFLLHRGLERAGGARANQFRNQIVMIVATLAAMLVLVVVLPLDPALRGQLLSLVGILLSAAIALSATTFLGNALAGIMLRIVRNFRMGDFIRVQEHFGRVSERGLFHTEIQTEDRELTTLPNLFLVTHPVTTIRTSGTVLSCSVSLGYDVPRSRVEELLLEAAREAGLQDPFVQIQDLGDFSVTYRAAGILTEVKRLVSVRSRLRGHVMDALHRGGVEIVSPTFMNTRAQPAERRFIPPTADVVVAALPATKEAAPDEVVFDKAEEAESLESLREIRAKVHKELGELEERAGKLPEGPEWEAAAAETERLRRRGELLDKLIAAREEGGADRGA